MINQFLRAGGVTSLKDFYNKFPTEEHFNHYVHMQQGGGIYAYQDGAQVPPRRADYMDNEEQWQTDMDAYTQGLGQPSAQKSAVATIPATAPVVTTSKPSSYGGISIVDFLNAQGKATDKGSRKKLAEALGISGYTGKAGENNKLLDMLKANPELLKDYPGSGIAKTATKAKSTGRALPVEKSNTTPPMVVVPSQQATSPYGYDSAIGERRAAPVQTAPTASVLPALPSGANSSAFGKVNLNAPSNRTNYENYTPKYTGMKPEQKGLYNKAWKTFQQQLARGENNPYIPSDIKGYYDTTEWDAALKDFKQQADPKKVWGQYATGGNYANVPQHGNPGVYSNGYSGTSSAGQYFDDGGAFIPDYSNLAPGQLPQYGYGKAMYGMGMADGGMYQEGGMPPEEAGMMEQQEAAPQQQAPDPQQVMQGIAQMLQQGAQPEQIMQQLVQMGIPQDQAQQMIQQVMQQMQGAQQEQPQPGMKRGGYVSGEELDVTPQQMEMLKQQGYKFDII
jgi:polyhydroxyalkanoate synthesis regulator phasin